MRLLVIEYDNEDVLALDVMSPGGGGPSMTKGDERTATGPHRSAGAGLGLSTARRIADVHEASIAVDSEPGRGTRVVVSFPLEEEK
jgi:signal transduction histidine kinase